ncbi:MAG: DNA cytosine methyltransferase, partial [Candidatus Baldrarchaeia archaeon]
TNFPEAVVIVEDIKELTYKDILDQVGDEPDVVIASPPCEPFTAANIGRRENPLERLYDDPIGRLTLHGIRMIADLQPKVFVLENVPQLIEGPLRDAIRKEFARVGFKEIYFNILRAEDYGNPSRRTRLFISNIKIKPKPVKKRKTVIEAIGDLPDPREPHDIPNHQWCPIPRRKRKKIPYLSWGEPLVRYMGAKGKVLTNWVRLHPYKLAPTILGNSRFIHPFDDRLLTVREHARLMSFPDDHVFCGGREVQYDQVGEAVPVVLAKAIAEEVMRYLKEHS